MQVGQPPLPQGVGYRPRTFPNPPGEVGSVGPSSGGGRTDGPSPTNRRDDPDPARRRNMRGGGAVVQISSGHSGNFLWDVYRWRRHVSR